MFSPGLRLHSPGGLLVVRPELFSRALGIRVCGLMSGGVWGGGIRAGRKISLLRDCLFGTLQGLGFSAWEINRLASWVFNSLMGYILQDLGLNVNFRGHA